MLHPLHTDIEKPKRMNNPFNYEPHQLCLLAAEEMKRWIETDPVLKEDADNGKMFGVLVVERTTTEHTEDTTAEHTENTTTEHTEGTTAECPKTCVCGEHELGFLAAYSGLLAGRNDWPQFVPPVYDAQQPDGHFKQTERVISDLNERLRGANGELADEERERLKALRKQMSEELQEWLFRQYRMLNGRGETKDLVEIWQDYHTRPKVRRKFPLPPGGSGDCCAPKLLQYAYQQGLRPVCMAEFWWGASPKAEVRHHGQYYPACRGKCLPILTWMLQGTDYDSELGVWGETTLRNIYLESRTELQTVYEDEWLAVINKPANMLTIPGREVTESVMTLMRERYPDYDGQLIVHRLDMATSGLLIISKDKQVNTLLQQQFEQRKVRKKYIALLDGVPDVMLAEPTATGSGRGIINLPLCKDPLDRPRQRVDRENGKPAVTEYEILGMENGHTRVALYPKTGRTHQLRVHCAHQDGLNCPILGDTLYGRKADRLYLHAAELWFTHPVTGEPMHITAAPEW